MAPNPRRVTGFTLIEVLIAIAITAFVAVVAYNALSTVIMGTEQARSQADRLQDINRTLSTVARDLRLTVNRPVRDEFGLIDSALTGGSLAREILSLTRSGWHNTVDTPRSVLQRVAYRLDDDKLLRVTYPVLDRTVSTEPVETVLLEGVREIELQFLGDIGALEFDRQLNVDRRYWQDSWIADVARPDVPVDLPVAVWLRLDVEGWDQLERLYVLAPL
jgi:general secretion pathway protein J